MSQTIETTPTDTVTDRIFKLPISYTTAAAALGLLNIAFLVVLGKPWGVSGVFYYWGAWVCEWFGANPETWAFFQNPKHLAVLEKGFLAHPITITNLSVILGALIATLLAGQFKIKKVKSFRQVVAAVIGGLFMGYGATIAMGCNIGGLFSGTSSFSLHGWVFMIFIFIGASIGGKLLVKYFVK